MRREQTTSLTVRSARIELKLRKDTCIVESVRNRMTGELLGTEMPMTVLVRTPREVSEPALCTVLRRTVISDSGITLHLEDAEKTHTAVLRIEPCREGIRFSVSAKAPQPVWMVEWRLGGFNFRNVVIPALGGQELTASMPKGTMLSYKYPFWWNAQFAAGCTRRGGLHLFSREAGTRMKLLRVKNAGEGFTLGYGAEAKAPLGSRTINAEWFLDCFKGNWEQPVETHRRWLEKAFRPVKLASNPRLPAWARSIDFVLELWGATKDRSEPLHTFPQMIRRLEEWRHLHAPERTLVYLPGFAEHGIDSHAPDYNPSEECGGPPEFKKLVDAAHAMGYRVMIHTNVLAMTFSHRLFRKFEKHQVVDCFGRKQGWGLDMDGDWLAEPYFAYINPGVREWTELMIGTLGGLIRDYALDAVFLDQTLLAFNAANGPDFIRGMRDHCARLQRAFPGVLFAGEGLSEQTVPVLPMAQIHGIDSIAEVHGMDGPQTWRKAHPVSTALFRPYTRYTAHLLTRHPSHPMFAMQEEAYGRLGVLPALCLYDHRQPMDTPEVRAMIRRAGTVLKKSSTQGKARGGR